MKTSTRHAALIGLIIMWWSFQGEAQQPSDELSALQAALETLKRGQAEIRQELEEIKALLQGQTSARRSPPGPVIISVEGDPYKGSPTAPVTIVEFSDYQCPYCARHVRDTLPKLEREYIDTGKVKYVFRDFPLTSIHTHAFKAAEAANCAGEQGKYWYMHDQLFAYRQELGDVALGEHARSVGLDVAVFQECLRSGRMAQEINKDLSEGHRAGVRGTPSFFIGRTDQAAPTISALYTLRGAKRYDAFRKILGTLLSKEK